MSELDLAIRAAQIGGEVVQKYFHSPRTSLKGLKDIITNADIEAEKTIKEFLLSHTDYGFLGEETGSKPGKKVWIVDPIDGTRPFSFGIPHFSTSIALATPKGIQAGVVLNPATKDIFIAGAGKGASWTGQLIKNKRNVPLLEQALVGCAFSYSRSELQKLDNLVGLCLVNFSPALDICNVANGRIHAAVYGLTDACDHTAAALIASETGIIVSNFGSIEWNPYGQGIIAAPEKIHQQLTKLFPYPLANLDRAEQQYPSKKPIFE